MNNELQCQACEEKIVELPKFCSKKCATNNVNNYLKRGFIWKNSTPEQREKHLFEYYERNIIRKDGCWDWKKAAKHEKYIRMNYCRTEPKLAIHIYSWRIHKGEIPQGMLVLHKCDNRRCSNPEHLFLGSNDDNIRDMINKRRHAFGSNHGSAKLNEEQVKNIRNVINQGHSLNKVAKDFGVSKRTIHRIKHRLIWKHVK